MFNTRLKSSLVALSIASVLSACGGGGGGDTTTPGVATNVTSSGTISGFGSVIVNGVHYETTSARIQLDDGTVIDDNPSNSDLQTVVGQGNIVKVRGTSNGSTGTANTITIDDELVGDITAGSINDTDATFVISGQTITVTPETIIDDSIIELMRNTQIPNDLTFGDLDPTTEPLSALLANVGKLEISGFPTSNGLQATRIEDVATSTTAGTSVVANPGQTQSDEVKGFVSNASASQFTINGLTVLYDSTDLDSEDFGSATEVVNGQFVEVHGSATNATNFDATRIELENEDDLLDDDFNEGEVEVEGIIQSITPTTGTAGIIVINTIEIPVDDISQFSVGMHIEIKAVLQNGTLQVTRVQDEGEDTVRIEDMAVGPAVNGVITTRLGIQIEASDRTRLEDDSDTLGDNPSLNEFLNLVDSNTHIEARGFPLNTGILWTRAEISNDAQARCRLRGSVASFDANASTITIEGVVIDASGSNTQFNDASDVPTTRQAFFDALTQNDNAVVQATSRDASGCTDGSLIAKEVEFELANDVLVGGDDNGVGDDNGNDINDNELSGAVSNIDDNANTFEIGGETVSVDGNTLIDDSIIEDARGGVELPADLLFGDASVTESLSELLVDGTTYVVNVDRSNGVVATSIEDL